jgi:hypothetical protein
MKFTTSSLLFVFALFASLCYSVPAQRQSKNGELKVAAAAAAPTLSVRPQVTPYSVKSTAPTASSPAPPPPAALAPAPAKTPHTLLSQATAEQAGGGVPGGPPPRTTFSATALQNFRVAYFIEGIESGFFAAALEVLNKDVAFTNASADGKSIANVTTQIAAQELVHKATLEGLLVLAGESTVPACANIYPVTDKNDFLTKANMVTSAAIGVIITILQSLPRTDPNLVGPLSSILSCEAQQDAFFRISGSNTPSASPFFTTLSTTFAYNIVLTLVDLRSCPQLIPLPILPSLNVTSPVMTATAPPTPPTSISFIASGVPQNGMLYVGWVNQANPVVYSNVTVKNGIGTADIPQGLTGIAFAGLTMQNSATTVDGLTNFTLAGPASIFMS